jgi:hypothetical protein
LEVVVTEECTQSIISIGGARWACASMPSVEGSTNTFCQVCGDEEGEALKVCGFLLLLFLFLHYHITTQFSLHSCLLMIEIPFVMTLLSAATTTTIYYIYHSSFLTQLGTFFYYPPQYLPC